MKELVKQQFDTKDIIIINITQFVYNNSLFNADERELIILYDIIKNKRMETIVLKAQFVMVLNSENTDKLDIESESFENDLPF